MLKPVPNQERQPLLCQGMATVQEVREPSEEGRYHSIQIKFESTDGGQDASAFLRFEPEFFASDYDPEKWMPNRSIPSKSQRAKDPASASNYTDEQIEDNDLRRSRTFVFETSLANQEGSGLLERLLDGPAGNLVDSFNQAMVELEKQDKLTPDNIRQVIASLIQKQGGKYIYLLRNESRRGDDGKYYFTDRMEVRGPGRGTHSGVYPLTKKGVEEALGAVKISQSAKKAQPIRVTFELGQSNSAT